MEENIMTPIIREFITAIASFGLGILLGYYLRGKIDEENRNDPFYCDGGK